MGKALAWSAAIHIALALVMALNSQSLLKRQSDSSQNSIEVRSVSDKDLQKKLSDALSSTEKQIVQSDDQLKSERAPQESFQKVFLSKHNQVVDQNTRAARVGTFKNVLREGPASVDLSPAAKLFQLAPSAKDLEQQQATNTKSGRLVMPEDRKPAADIGEGYSATNDYLEDVAVSANTLLNTQEFKFYSFYERIRERLSSEWERRLGAVFDSLYLRQEGINFDRRTKVQVTMNRRGDIQEIRVLASSGIRELDAAATGAFVGASPFPNPPSDMIDKAEKVVVRWDFVVMAEGSGRMRVEVKRMPAGF
jgi:TonB family protein